MAAEGATEKEEASSLQNGAASTAAQLIRKIATYSNEGDSAFLLAQRAYRNQQFASLYFARLAMLRPALQAEAQRRWPSLPVCGVLDLQQGKECVVVGSLYKTMRLKPSVLDEYSRERSHTPLVYPHNFVSDDDYLVLEDERGRVKLVGTNIKPQHYVTGLVVAVKGMEDSDGDFAADCALSPGVPPVPPRATLDAEGAEAAMDVDTANGHALAPSAKARGHDGNDDIKYVLLLSGLRFGDEPMTGVEDLHRQLLLDLITGHVHSDEELALSSSIVRVVIAGDSCAPISVTHPDALSSPSVSAKDSKALLVPLKQLDVYLAQIASAVPVDLMPGATDPANFSLPQQPMHQCLVPLSTRAGGSRADVVRAPNPHAFTVDDVHFLGTSGQNIDDMGHYSLAPPAAAACTNTSSLDGAAAEWEAAVRGEPPGQAGADSAAASGAAAAAAAEGAAAERSSGGVTAADGGSGGAVGENGLPGSQRDDGGARGGGEGGVGEDVGGEWSSDLFHMETCLRWRHLAPTAPDTLGCYPFQMDDPFIISSSPHVFFAGNCSRYATKLVRAPVQAPEGGGRPVTASSGQREGVVRLVAVPSFSHTSQAVLVDLRTLDCHVLSFSTDALMQ